MTYTNKNKQHYYLACIIQCTLLMGMATPFVCTSMEESGSPLPHTPPFINELLVMLPNRELALKLQTDELRLKEMRLTLTEQHLQQKEKILERWQMALHLKEQELEKSRKNKQNVPPQPHDSGQRLPSLPQITEGIKRKTTNNPEEGVVYGSKHARETSFCFPDNE